MLLSTQAQWWAQRLPYMEAASPLSRFRLSPGETLQICRNMSWRDACKLPVRCSIEGVRHYLLLMRTRYAVCLSRRKNTGIFLVKTNQCYHFSLLLAQRLPKKDLCKLVKGIACLMPTTSWGGEGHAGLAVARAWVLYRNCQNPTLQDACGACQSCRLISKGMHPDVHYCFPRAPAESHSQKEAVKATYETLWRGFLQEFPYGTFDAWSNYLHNQSTALPAQIMKRTPIIGKQQAEKIVRVCAMRPYMSATKHIIIWLAERMKHTGCKCLAKKL